MASGADSAQPVRDGHRTLCLTGPESSGKTTLAACLAQVLDAVVVDEVARGYLAGRRSYGREDLLRIAELVLIRCDVVGAGACRYCRAGDL